MPPRRTPPRPDEASPRASASPATTNGPNLQFISSEIARVPKLDISTCTPDGFQIWKQRWNSAVTITAFADLPRGTQQAIFTNVLSDDTVKRMNILGLQDVNAIIEAFQTQVCGSLSIFVHEYEFHNRSQVTNESFEEFYTDLQTQVTVIEASLQLPVVQSSDEVDLSSRVRDYQEVFDETVLPAMSGEPFEINLKPNATPYAQLKARRIPIPYMEQLKRQLHDMEKLGVISPHEEPSPCCHPIVIAPKKGTDELRICIDFTRLNKFIQREYHLSNSPFQAVTSIPREELAYFCKFDARHGYWQVPLAAESRPLTCFITPFGRYVCN